MTGMPGFNLVEATDPERSSHRRQHPEPMQPQQVQLRRLRRSEATT
jgi:hypothetical protein